MIGFRSLHAAPFAAGPDWTARIG